MLNWTAWNRTVFNAETVLKLNWIVWYRTVLTYNCVEKIYTYTKLNCLNKLNSLKQKCFWELNCVLMLYWIVWNRTVCIKMDLALNNLQRLICHKTQPPFTSVDETLLLTSFREPPFSVEMSSFWLKHMYSVLSAFAWRPMLSTTCSWLSSRDSAWVGVFAKSTISSL